MKTKKILWKKQSAKNSCFYIGVETVKGLFITSQPLQVTEKAFNELNVGDTIEVPTELLK
jgi:hypothetical protein